jgi:ankyrin repeat protein
MDRFRPRKRRRRKTLFGCVGMALLISACAGIPSGREGNHDAGAAHLHAVTRVGTPAALACLMNHGADPDAREPETLHTLLETAILTGRRDQVSTLLKAGANPDLTDSVGNTALHIAAQTNQPWLALELLKAGAGPDIRNEQGKTFLTYLFLMRDDLLSQDARDGKQEVVDWLRSHGLAAEPCC